VGASYFPHEASDAPLRLGETYTLENNSITMEVVHVNAGNYIDVAITLSPTTRTEAPSVSDIYGYPSPVVDQLYLEGTGDVVYTIDLFDLHGKLILSQSGTHRIDMSSLPGGLYILVLTNPQNHQRIVRRIVKQ
jgi:hypothetical protein